MSAAVDGTLLLGPAVSCYRRLMALRRRASKPTGRRASTLVDAERRLLDLARSLPRSPTEAVRALAEAHRPNAPLPRAVAAAWLAGARDKTRALALAWAREQVRLALEDALSSARLWPSTDRATAAWLVLAACEALAYEPAAAAADRVATVLALID